MAKKKKGQKGKGKDPFYKNAKVYGYTSYDFSMDTGWGAGDIGHGHGGASNIGDFGGRGINNKPLSSPASSASLNTLVQIGSGRPVPPREVKGKGKKGK